MTWQEPFELALRGGDPLAASDALRKERREGRIRRAEHEAAARIVERLAPSSLVRRDWAARLLAHPRRVDKELAASLLLPLVATHPSDVERAIQRLAVDDDWEVREWAASLLGRALGRAWEHFAPRALAWSRQGPSRLRRAVVVAAKYAGRARVRGRGDALLDLLEPAVGDHDEYLRRSLGPFAVGDGLLRAYPGETLARLEAWAARSEPDARWNAAMAFSTASAAAHADRARPLLRALADDPEPFVRRAAATALRRLGARVPEIAAPAPAGAV